jgi:hypothetical protein
MFFSKRACNALSSSSRCFADKSLFAFAPFIAISSSLIVSCYDDLFTPFFSGQFLGPISSKRIVDEGDGLSTSTRQTMIGKKINRAGKAY